MNDIKFVRSFLIIGLFFATGGLAVANDLTGTWEGTGQAVFPDGTIIGGITFVGTAEQDETTGLFSAIFTFTFIDPSTGHEVSQNAFATGHATKNGKLTGLLSALIDQDAPPVAFAVFEGKVSGNKITGVVRDFNDTSTSVLSGTRVR